LSRDTTRSEELDLLADRYLRFVLDARIEGGGFHNRRHADGSWLDDVGSDDSQGRAWWGLGVAARHGRTPDIREAAMAAFDDCPGVTADHLRPNAFAILGAVEVLALAPHHVAARALLRRSTDRLITAAATRIPWVEPRLTYDNARLPEAFLAAGATLDDPALVRTGLRLLSWLVEAETVDDHFSFTPAGGWAPGEPRPAFDQQPVEAVAMAEACHRAWRSRATRSGATALSPRRGGSSGTTTWARPSTMSGSGGTCDGLMVDGVNENQGAESTLAGLGALQVAGSFGRDRSSGAPS
jgi:hypothetical protein